MYLVAVNLGFSGSRDRRGEAQDLTKWTEVEGRAPQLGVETPSSSTGSIILGSTDPPITTRTSSSDGMVLDTTLLVTSTSADQGPSVSSSVPIVLDNNEPQKNSTKVKVSHNLLYSSTLLITVPSLL